MNKKNTVITRLLAFANDKKREEKGEQRFMKKVFKKAATSLFVFVVMISLLTIPAVADENATSIETDKAKLSFVGTRMLDSSVPSGDSVGKDYVLVIYNYENYTTDPKSPQADFYPTVYQNGVELDSLGSRNVNDTEDCKILDGFFKTVIKASCILLTDAGKRG